MGRNAGGRNGTLAPAASLVLLRGAAEAIETGNAEAVAGPGMVDQFRQGRTLEPSARDHVDEHANGASLNEPVALGVGVLVVGRDASVAQGVADAGRRHRLNIVRFQDGFRGSATKMILENQVRSALRPNQARADRRRT